MRPARTSIVGPLVERRVAERRPGAEDRRAEARGGRRCGDSLVGLSLEAWDADVRPLLSSVVRTGRRTGDVMSITPGPWPGLNPRGEGPGGSASG